MQEKEELREQSKSRKGQRERAQGAQQLGRIARNRSRTGIIAENEQDTAGWLRARSAP